jgi:hypothetical protein
MVSATIRGELVREAINISYQLPPHLFISNKIPRPIALSRQ